MNNRISTLARSISFALSVSCCATSAFATPSAAEPEHHFVRLSTFPTFLNTDVDTQSVAEILDTSMDGNTVVYTDGKAEVIGFVDIRDRYRPKPAGIVNLDGEPTSVAVAGHYALAAVNTSLDFVNTGGELVVIDMSSHEIVAKHDLGGQPDSIAVSPDKRYAAIAIENERDEDLGTGEPPQAPAGYVMVVDLEGKPQNWQLTKVDVTGQAPLFPEDPEPEYVSINHKNIAAISLQENNYIVLIDLAKAAVVGGFDAGKVDLDGVDIKEERVIRMDGSLQDIPREPDGVTWISDDLIATANEGDLYGGSRGFSIFDRDGNLQYDSGTELEELVTSAGHYPDKRSENKGNEPENVAHAKIGKDEYLFVGSERSSVIYVYTLDAQHQPKFLQMLPAGVGPEGLALAPYRGLLLVANEVDARDDKIRGSISLYQRLPWASEYPTVVSKAEDDGKPISWGALSGLSVDPSDDDTLYSVSDSFYKTSSIFKLDASQQPAQIVKKIPLRDSMGKLAARYPELVNEDGTAHLDLEGIAVRQGEGFWVASEGRGSVDDEKRPVEFENMLVQVSSDGVIEDIVTLPVSVNQRQHRFGFEGVAVVGDAESETLFVAFQREWVDDPKGLVRIGRYDVSAEKWSFYYYPLDKAESPNGGWVGLSEISYVGRDSFLVLERDNQAGPDAAVKRIYEVWLGGEGKADVAEGTPDFPVLKKYLKRNVMEDLRHTGGLMLEKVEGLTVLKDGTGIILNDNDGVDDSNGGTQLIRIHNLLKQRNW